LSGSSSNIIHLEVVHQLLGQGGVLGLSEDCISFLETIPAEQCSGSRRRGEGERERGIERLLDKATDT
jgi:hypothetical protein